MAFTRAWSWPLSAAGAAAGGVFQTQGAAQSLGIDQQAAARGQIGHVQRHHHGQAQALHRQHQAQIAAQIGGVQHADHQVRPLLAAGAAGQHIAGHAFIGRARVEAVGAGQVQQAQHLARGRLEPALLALHRDPGVVGHLLAAAGQAVEERGLAAVRIAHQGQQGAGRMEVDHGLLAGAAHAASLFSRMQAASARRRANVDCPMRTTRGSPPSKARLSTRTGSPATKPICSSQGPHSGAWAGGTRAATRCDRPISA
jgi:hypothetical protein